VSAKLHSAALLLVALPAAAQTSQPDWPKVEEETLRHFQALLRIDTSDPPGKEKPAVDYLRQVLEAEGIPVQVFALEPDRPNLVARLKSTGKKRPILIMGHTDVVSVDPKKWTFPPFSASRDGGFVYGRGAVDDKDNATAGMMTLVLLKRLKVPLDRDVILLNEAGEEGSTRVGIQHLVKEHFPEIDAEYCFAEGGGVARRGGQVQFASVQTTEKIPYAVSLVAHGPAGHGSVPLRNAAIAHLAAAIAKIATWNSPVRLNETTKAYFERLAPLSSPEDAARYRALAAGDTSAALQDYLAEKEPRIHSTLRTSVSPNIIKGGYRNNVIPSQAEATLDVRALPDEKMPEFLDALRKLIADPAIEVKLAERDTRPGAAPSRLDSEAFLAAEAALKRVYGAPTLPIMSTGATDMAYLRAKGIQCYGIGPATDVEDGPKGFGAHSDQERILESEIHRFVKFNFELVRALAAAK
jgi:acetylornithine deacetylase/succinyl-diaminopimelate desuccinylase-like protein